MNSHAHLHLAQHRAQDLRAEAHRDHVARAALAARPAAPAVLPLLNVRALLVRLRLA